MFIPNAQKKGIKINTDMKSRIYFLGDENRLK